MERSAYVERVTNEVKIRVYIDLDRESSGEPFIPPPGSAIPEPFERGVRLEVEIQGEYGPWFKTSIHWIEQIARHGRFDLRVEGWGDNEHHLNEDAAILIGQTLKQAMGDRVGILRFAETGCSFEGNACTCTLDFSGRPFLAVEESEHGKISGEKQLWELLISFFRPVCTHAGIDMYVQLHAMEGYASPHHLAELVYKTFGRAVLNATRIIGKEVASTKGLLD